MSRPFQLSEILKFGVDKLLSSDESSVQDVNLQNIFGSSRGGQWVDDEDLKAVAEEEEEEERPESDELSMFFLLQNISLFDLQRAVVSSCRPHVHLWGRRLQSGPKLRGPEDLWPFAGGAAGWDSEGCGGGTSSETQSWSEILKPVYKPKLKTLEKFSLHSSLYYPYGTFQVWTLINLSFFFFLVILLM